MVTVIVTSLPAVVVTSSTENSGSSVSGTVTVTPTFDKITLAHTLTKGTVTSTASYKPAGTVTTTVTLIMDKITLTHQ